MPSAHLKFTNDNCIKFDLNYFLSNKYHFAYNDKRKWLKILKKTIRNFPTILKVGLIDKIYIKRFDSKKMYVCEW